MTTRTFTYRSNSTRNRCSQTPQFQGVWLQRTQSVVGCSMRHTHAAFAFAFAVAIALTACGAEAPAAEVTPDAVETPVAPTEPTGPVAGAAITADQVDAAKAAGLGIYRSPSGALFAIDKNAPLPAEVIADIKATAGGAGSAAAAAGDQAGMVARSDARESAMWAAFDTGKTLVFIAAGGRYGQDGSLQESYFGIGTNDRNIVPVGTKFGSADEALAHAQAAVAASSDPTRFEIIDLTR